MPRQSEQAQQKKREKDRARSEQRRRLAKEAAHPSYGPPPPPDAPLLERHAYYGKVNPITDPIERSMSRGLRVLRGLNPTEIAEMVAYWHKEGPLPEWFHTIPREG